MITIKTSNVVGIVENVLMPEMFLGIVITFLLLHGTLLTSVKTRPLFLSSYINLGVLTLFMTFYLIFNGRFIVMESTTFNDSVVNDYLGYSTKLFLTFVSTFCLVFLKGNVKKQKINQFEYVLSVLFVVLSLLLLVSANDLLTAYLSIELQAISFYVLCSIKRSSSFSIEAGLKFFIVGSFSSCLFLFGSSIIYGVTGTISFEDLRDMYFWIFPGSVVTMSNIDFDFYQKEKKEVILDAIAEKIKKGIPLSIKDGEFIKNDFYEIFEDGQDWIKIKIGDSYQQIVVNLIDKLIDNDLKNYANYSKFTYPEQDYKQNTQFFIEFFVIANELQSKMDNCYLDGAIYERRYDKDEVPNVLLMVEQTCSNEMLMQMVAKNCWNISIAAELLPFWLFVENDLQDELYFSKLFNFKLINIGLVFVVTSLFIKLAVVPFHLWMPNVYQGSPTGTTFLLAVIPKLAIFVLLIRIFYYSLFGLMEEWKFVFAFFTIITVFVGAFGGLEQTKLKSLMAYSSISNIGYSLMSFSTGTFEGVQMLLTYFFIYTVSNLCIWAIFLQLKLKNNYSNKISLEVTDLAQLGKSNKIIAVLTTITLFSIAGLPPMVGFIGKLGIYFSCIQGSMYFLATTVILCSVVGTFYYVRVIKIMYFENLLVGKLYYPIKSETTILIAFFVFLLLFFFLDPSLIFLFTYKIILLFTT